jgi:hypothetical protein
MTRPEKSLHINDDIVNVYALLDLACYQYINALQVKKLPLFFTCKAC